MRGACALLLLTACFSPNVQSNDKPDAGTTDGSGSAAGSFHVGTQMLRDTTLAAEPTGAVMISAAINTGATSAGNCTQIVGKLCIVAGATITIPTGATIRAIGPNALLLVAAQTIAVQGTLDASSRFNETLGGVAVYGAGARDAVGCNAAGVDGTAGSGNNGGGGAAGGSFGGSGAAGGTGKNNTAKGNPLAAVSPTTFLGGCAGGHGGDGAGNMGGGGLGGAGGGAVYLFAGGSINVSGKISASGSGGTGGGPGFDSSGGGGGGGSGGMLVLESPQITVTGMLYANGGGGGAGGGNTGMGDAGGAGADVSAPTTAASGGSGDNGGGGGGAGAFGATAAVVGKNASGNASQSAGGGGGGGVGVIRMFGTSTTTGATISPAAS